MLEHTFKEITLKNGNITKKKIIVRFADPGFEPLEVFFSSEYENFADKIKEGLDSVLNGRKEQYVFTGNICRLVIEKGESRLCDIYAGDGAGKACSLSTRELKALADEYNKRRKI